MIVFSSNDTGVEFLVLTNFVDQPSWLDKRDQLVYVYLCVLQLVYMYILYCFIRIGCRNRVQEVDYYLTPQYYHLFCQESLEPPTELLPSRTSSTILIRLEHIMTVILRCTFLRRLHISEVMVVFQQKHRTINKYSAFIVRKNGQNSCTGSTLMDI